MSREITIEVADGTYAGIDFGGEGRDVLLLHQLSSNAEVWRPIGEALAEVAHPVAIDLLGHGRSTVPEGDIGRIVGDLPAIVEALGLERPLLITQFEEILSLSPDRLAGLNPCGILVLNLCTYELGEAGRAEWNETDGPSSLAMWDERFGLLASGTDDEREAHITETVKAAETDWVMHRVATDSLRAYVERKIRDTPDGWTRVPRREVLEAALTSIEDEPHGIEAVGEFPGVAWVAVPFGHLLPQQLQALEDYAAAHEGMTIQVVGGGPMVRSMDTDSLVAVVGDMFRGPCRED